MAGTDQKSPKFLLFREVFPTHFGDSSMRIAQTIFVGSIAVLAALVSPASAKNTSPNSHANANAQAVEESPALPGCHAYQKAADGSWVEIACHEGAGSTPPVSRGKSAKSGG